MASVLLIGGCRAGSRINAPKGDRITVPELPDEWYDWDESDDFMPMNTTTYRLCPFMWHGERMLCGVPFEWGEPETWSDTLRARIEDSVMAVVPIPEPEPDTYKWRM